MQRCEFCGHEMPSNVHFCGNCGQAQSVDAKSVTQITTLSELKDAALNTPPLFSDPALPTIRATQGEYPGADATMQEPVSDQIALPPDFTFSDASQVEERRFMPPEAVLPLALLAEEAPAGQAPMVQGTPQIGEVPHVQGTPSSPASAPPGQVPGQHFSPPSAPHAGPSAQSWQPSAPEHQPFEPVHHPPVHDPQRPQQHPQQSQHLHHHEDAPTEHHAPRHEHEHEHAQHHADTHMPRSHRPHLRPTHTTAAHTATTSKLVVGTATKWLIVAMTAVVVAATSGAIFVLANAPAISLTGSSSSIAAGGTLHIHGKGFLPGGSVTLTLDNGQPVAPAVMRPAGLAQAAQQGSGQSADVLLSMGYAAPNDSPNTTIPVSVTGSFDVDVTALSSWPAGPHIIHARESLGSRGADLQFTILASPVKPANLVVNPASLTFKVQAGASESQSIDLSNTGQANLNWSAASDGSSWLSLQGSAGVIAGHGQDAILDVTASSGHLAVGTYHASITVNSNGGQVQVPITLQVLAPTPQKQAQMEVNPTSIDFGQLPPGQQPTQSLTVSNLGTASLVWHASTGTASWLSLSTSGGTLKSGALPQALQVQVDTSGLAPGNYAAFLTITSNGGNAKVAVSFVVPGVTPTPPSPTPPPPPSPTPPPPSPTPTPTATWTVNPNNLDNNSSSCSGGPTTYSCSVTLAEDSSSNTNITWSASDSVGGVSFSPSSTTLTPGGSQQVTISNIPCQNDTFTFTDNANVASPLSVTWACKPPSIAKWTVSPTSLAPSGSTCDGGPTYVCTVTLTEDASSNTNITWSASDSVGGVSFSPSSTTLTPGGPSQSVTISNIPCQDDTFTFTDNAGVASALNVPWTCTPPPPPPSPTPTPQPTLTISLSGPCPSDNKGNYVCTDTLTVSGGQGTISWSVSAESDLPGTTFNPPNGKLSTGQSQQVAATIPASDCPVGGHYDYSWTGSNSQRVTFTCPPPPSPTPSPTPSPSPQPTPSNLKILGGLPNLNGFCQSTGYASATSIGNTAYDWRCVSSSGQQAGISMTAACQWQWQDSQAEDLLTNFYDPQGWECFTNAQDLGNATNWNGYCQSTGYASATLAGNTAYDWKCVSSSGQQVGISVANLCEWQYNINPAVGRLTNFYDPNAWQCWG